jgi:sugar transferase (PEP-CTERM/EpsH1 system associated)
MGEILFLSHRIPFPPDRGDKIRSHHLLLSIAREHVVHVATFAETAADRAARDAFARVSASHCLVSRTKPLLLAGAQALLAGKPVSMTAFDDSRLRRYVREVLASRPIDTIFVFSGQMGQYVPDDWQGRVVMDLCDVDSAKFDAYRQSGGPKSAIYRREGRLLALEEARLAYRADATILISDAEAKLLASRMDNPAGANIVSMRNGIDTDLFDPAAVEPQPELAAGAGPQIVFTGQMDYQPNVDAALRMMDKIMPRIRETCPDAVFHCVGRAPVRSLVRRDTGPGIRVWGEVPDVRPFLKSCDVVVAPLIIARGIQNKVLEAMAMSCPVVLSPEAATGIEATGGRDFLIAGDDAGMADAVLHLWHDRGKRIGMGNQARRFVMNEQGWKAMLAPLSALLSQPQRHAA